MRRLLNNQTEALDIFREEAVYIFCEKAIRALSPAEPVQDTSDFSRSIAEVIKEESIGGAACGWHSCTGCLETSDGYHYGDYPYSETFKAHVGSGCHECGGIGVVWEYYSKAELDEMQHEANPAEPAQCQTCNGHGRVGGLVPWGDGEVDSICEACPDCTPAAPTSTTEAG